MEQTYPLAPLVATGLLLASIPSLRASETDDRIETSAKLPYVFNDVEGVKSVKHDRGSEESDDG